MKTRILLISLTTAIALATSCRPDPLITFSVESQEMAAAGGNLSVKMTSNYPWTASASDSWISIGTTSGQAGEVTLTISVAPNTQPDGRSGSVTVTCEGLMRSIQIKQLQKNTVISTSGDAVSVSWDATSFELQVQTNVDFTVEVSEPWLQYVSVKSLTPKTVTFIMEINDSHSGREALVAFTSGGEVVKQISITQNGRPQVFKFVHENKVMKAPVIFGFGMAATIDWGDGTRSAYNSTLSHSYISAVQYEVTVEATQASTASLNDIVGVTKVDLSQF